MSERFRLPAYPLAGSVYHNDPATFRIDDTAGKPLWERLDRATRKAVTRGACYSWMLPSCWPGLFKYDTKIHRMYLDVLKIVGGEPQWVSPHLSSTHSLPCAVKVLAALNRNGRLENSNDPLERQFVACLKLLADPDIPLYAPEYEEESEILGYILGGADYKTVLSDLIWADTIRGFRPAEPYTMLNLQLALDDVAAPPLQGYHDPGTPASLLAEQLRRTL